MEEIKIYVSIIDENIKREIRDVDRCEDLI